MEKEIISFKKTDLPINICKLNMCQGAKYRGMHSHSAVEAVVVKRGTVYCLINNEKICLSKNDIVFINSNTGHSLSAQNADISYMQIEPNFFIENVSEDDFSNIHRFISYTKAKPYLIFSSSKEAIKIIEKIYSKYNENEKTSRLYLKAYTYELFAFLCANEFILPTITSIDKIKKIKPIVDYIDTNFKTNVTLDEICSVVSYNKYAVCHYFKSVTGSTVFDYINFLRVHFAVEKLKEKENSILEIALESGFSSPTYFNRVFKNVMGCSPSTYRKFLAENSIN